MITIVAISLLGVLLMFLGFALSKKALLAVAMLSLVAGIGTTLYEMFHMSDLNISLYGQSFMNNMLVFDTPAALFTLTMLTTTLLILPFASEYVNNEHAQAAEYYALILFTIAGGIIMVSFTNVLMLFIGLEILSISVYILTGSDKRNLRSNEAALKYFLMGAFATGILLFGVALTYAATGSFSLQGIASGSVFGYGQSLQLKSLGALLIIIGLLFKVSAAPFHFWTPDVYEGAPTVFTAFMATVVKTAGFAALLRILSISFGDLQSFWSLAIIVSIVLTLIIGNLLAVVQNSFKRMLAYSSIAHAGYMLLGVLAIGSPVSLQAILYYSLAYGVATASAFGVLILVSENKGSENYDTFAGLGKSDPLLAAVLTIAMCSLAGIPLTAGFIGKFYLFIATLDTDNLYLLVPVVIGSAISVYYYFRVITIMYMGERSNGAIITQKGQLKFWLVAGSVITILLGTVPDVLKVFLVQ